MSSTGSRPRAAALRPMPSRFMTAYRRRSSRLLAPARAQMPAPHSDYEANAGWVAFTRLDAGGALQIWTRSPAGVIARVTSFGTSSRIDALGPDGTVVFTNGSRRYVVPPGGTPH